MAVDFARHAKFLSSYFACHALRASQIVKKLRSMPKGRVRVVDAPQQRGNQVLGANIKRVRKALGLTLEDLAHEVGSDAGNLSRLERGLQGYTDDGLKRIARVLRTTVSELFAEYAGGDLAITAPPATTHFNIPVFDAKSSMGMGIVAYPEQETIVGGLQLSEQWVRRNVGYSSAANLAVLSAFGDSMEPTFRDGDVILFDKGITQLRLDAVYVVSLHGELFIKRIQRRPDKSIVMKSDNPFYDPYIVPPAELDSFRVVGKVVFAWNGKKM